ncbi:MAG: pyridoxal-phosphate dependent enzyme, partial [Armatimonadetes bacterium]|nr:pyridoxal-phosphate dependent enzyme [Armatimonadota bacterium]
LWFGCGHCRDAGGHPHWLEVRYNLEGVDPTSFRRPGRVWDYRALLPLPQEAEAPTLGEGNTPLVRIPALNRELGLPNLYLKLESVNPTASFKDRFHTVSLAVARQLGYRRALVTTAGNHGTSCAAYARRAGLELLVITHPNSSREQLRLMRLFGARVTAPTRPGPVMPLARALMDQLVREHQFYPSTVLGTFTGPANPYGVEGYKTIGYEVLGQLGRMPDRICVPTSAGDALYGPYKGLKELQVLGLVDRLPRMTACQAEGANFAVRSLRSGQPDVSTVEPTTFALSIGDPTGGQCILDAVRSTDGDAWDAPDAELLECVALLGRHGVCVEGASAAPVAALRRQVAAGGVDRDELIVAVLTGSGIKWPAQVDAAIGPPEPFLPDDPALLLEQFAWE